MRRFCYSKWHSHVLSMGTLSLLISFLSALLKFAGKCQRREGLKIKNGALPQQPKVGSMAPLCYWLVGTTIPCSPVLSPCIHWTCPCKGDEQRADVTPLDSFRFFFSLVNSNYLATDTEQNCEYNCEYPFIHWCQLLRSSPQKMKYTLDSSISMT